MPTPQNAVEQPLTASPTPTQVAVPPQPTEETQTTVTEPKYAGLGRLSALFIDSIICSIVVIIIMTTIGLPAGQEQAVFGVTSYVYNIFFVILFSTTPGKAILRMKIVDTNYEKPSLLKKLLRESVGKMISSVLIMISAPMVIIDKRHRSLHDMIAGTYVVYK